MSPSSNSQPFSFASAMARFVIAMVTDLVHFTQTSSRQPAAAGFASVAGPVIARVRLRSGTPLASEAAPAL